jgi:hypothetical protein
LWQRIVLAMAAGEVKLADYLGRSLPEGEVAWWDRWPATHRDPQQVLDAERLEGPHPRIMGIIAHGIARPARISPGQAADPWNRLAVRHGFPPDQAEAANAAIGFALSEVRAPWASHAPRAATCTIPS